MISRVEIGGKQITVLDINQVVFDESRALIKVQLFHELNPLIFGVTAEGVMELLQAWREYRDTVYLREADERAKLIGLVSDCLKPQDQSQLHQ